MEKISLLDDLYKLYNKIQKLNIDSSISCLTQNEMYIITNIENNMTVNDLAKKLDLTMGTVSIAMNKLENKQFIERIKDIQDKRKVYVKLTNKGNISKKIANEFITNTFKDAFLNVEEDKREIFFDVLEQVVSKMQKIKDKLEPICINDMEIGDIATVDMINAKGTVLRYITSIGIIYGNTIKLLNKDNYNLYLDIEGYTRKINKEDLKNIYVLIKDNK